MAGTRERLCCLTGLHFVAHPPMYCIAPSMSPPYSFQRHRFYSSASNRLQHAQTEERSGSEQGWRIPNRECGIEDERLMWQGTTVLNALARSCASSQCAVSPPAYTASHLCLIEWDLCLSIILHPPLTPSWAYAVCGHHLSRPSSPPLISLENRTYIGALSNRNLIHHFQVTPLSFLVNCISLSSIVRNIIHVETIQGSVRNLLVLLCSYIGHDPILTRHVGLTTRRNTVALSTIASEARLSQQGVAQAGSFRSELGKLCHRWGKVHSIR